MKGVAGPLTVIALLLASPEAGASEVTFVIHRHGGAAPAFDLVLTKTSSHADATRVRRSVESERSLKIELDRGEWLAEVDTETLWSRPQYFSVGGDREIPIDVWPAGRIHGRFVSEAKETPTRLEVTFDGKAALGEPVMGQTSCPLRDGLFTCILPAGSLDLRIRAAGHIARFFWEVSTSLAQPHDMGVVTLHEGQSIVGRVELPARSASVISKTVIHARLRDTTTEAGPQLPGARLSPQRTNADKKGNFQLDGLRPGEHVILATHPDGLTSTEMVVAVAEGREVEVRTPLRLSTPRKIDVAILPPAGPDGRLWRVDVSRYVGRDVLTPVASSHASFAGVWLSPPLPAGQYQITIAHQGGVWYREDLPVAQADESRIVTLSGRLITGRVRLGDKPIRASLAFGDDRGRHAKCESDEDGRFAVVLVDRSRRTWAVTVESQAPEIRRTLHGVEIGQDDSVELYLPDSILSGSVVDEKGVPIALALITASSKAGEFIQTTAAPDGRFSIHGFASGQYDISAESQRHVADSITIDFDAQKRSPDVRLIGRKRRELQGRVMSAYGPVAGAQVVVRARNRGASRLHPYTTGSGGSFAVTVPQQVRDFDVISMSSGFAFQLDRVVYSEEPITILLNQRGGTLILETNERNPFLVRAGATMPLRLLQNRWSVEIETAADGTTRTIAPMMAPGSYSLCSVLPANVDLFRNTGGAVGGKRCVAGHLDLLGTLSLELSP